MLGGGSGVVVCWLGGVVVCGLGWLGYRTARVRCVCGWVVVGVVSCVCFAWVIFSAVFLCVFGVFEFVFVRFWITCGVCWMLDLLVVLVWVFLGVWG